MTTAAWPGALPDDGRRRAGGQHSDHHGRRRRMTSFPTPSACRTPFPLSCPTLTSLTAFPASCTGSTWRVNEELRVIAFTDREQSVVAQPAVNFARYTNYGAGDGEVIAIGEVGDLGESPDGGDSYPGTSTRWQRCRYRCCYGNVYLHLPDCSFALNDAGTGVDDISGYTFTGTRAARAAVVSQSQRRLPPVRPVAGRGRGRSGDGVDGGDDTFGSFGGGGDAFVVRPA